MSILEFRGFVYNVIPGQFISSRVITNLWQNFCGLEMWSAEKVQGFFSGIYFSALTCQMTKGEMDDEEKDYYENGNAFDYKKYKNYWSNVVWWMNYLAVENLEKFEYPNFGHDDLDDKESFRIYRKLAYKRGIHKRFWVKKLNSRGFNSYGMVPENKNVPIMYRRFRSAK